MSFLDVRHISISLLFELVINLLRCLITLIHFWWGKSQKRVNLFDFFLINNRLQLISELSNLLVNSFGPDKSSHSFRPLILLHVESGLNGINISLDLILGEIVDDLLWNFLKLFSQFKGSCESLFSMLLQSVGVSHGVHRFLIELGLVFDTSSLLCLWLFFFLLISLSGSLFHVHGIRPLWLDFVYQNLKEFFRLSALVCCWNLLVEFLSLLGPVSTLLGELESLAKSVDLPDAVLVIPAVVLVPQAILRLGGFDLHQSLVSIGFHVLHLVQGIWWLLLHGLVNLLLFHFNTTKYSW